MILSGYLIVLTHDAWLAESEAVTSFSVGPYHDEIGLRVDQSYRGMARAPVCVHQPMAVGSRARISKSLEAVAISDNSLDYRYLIDEPESAWGVLDEVGEPDRWEVIHVDLRGGQHRELLGFDVGWWQDGGFFSALADSMHFPRFHPPVTDSDVASLRPVVRKLNSSGLFDSPGEADSFADFYLGTDWGEAGELSSIAVSTAHRA